MDITLAGRLIFQVFDLMRKQEETRLADVAAEKAQYHAIQAQGEVVSFLSMVFLFSLLHYGIHSGVTPCPANRLMHGVSFFY